MNQRRQNKQSNGVLFAAIYQVQHSSADISVAYLYRVEAAVRGQREADGVRGRLLPRAGDPHSVPQLREHLADDAAVGAQGDPVPRLRGHVDHDAPAARVSIEGLGPPLAPPAPQLRLQGLQLEELGLLVQRTVLLHTHTYTHTHNSQLFQIRAMKQESLT